MRDDNSTGRKNQGDPGRSRFGPKANKTMTLLTLLQHCSLDSADQFLSACLPGASVTFSDGLGLATASFLGG